MLSALRIAVTYPIRNLASKELSHPSQPGGQIGCDSLDELLVEDRGGAMTATCSNGTAAEAGLVGGVKAVSAGRRLR